MTNVANASLPTRAEQMAMAKAVHQAVEVVCGSGNSSLPCSGPLYSLAGLGLLHAVLGRTYLPVAGSLSFRPEGKAFELKSDLKGQGFIMWLARVERDRTEIVDFSARHYSSWAATAFAEDRPQ